MASENPQAIDRHVPGERGTVTKGDQRGHVAGTAVPIRVTTSLPD